MLLVSLWESIQQNPYLSVGASFLLVWVPAWFILYRSRPLTFMHVALRLMDLDIGLSKLDVSITIPAHWLVLGWLWSRPRVLDAWVTHHLELARDAFESDEAISVHTIYIPMPVEFEGEMIPEPEAASFHDAFAKRQVCILIHGEPGTGKTALACQLARWAMMDEPKDRLRPHAMIPVFIDTETRGKDSIVIVQIGPQLQWLLQSDEPVPQRLISALVRQGRILVIVDRLSEMSPQAQANFMSTATPEDLRPGALVITSRQRDVVRDLKPLHLEAQQVDERQVGRFLWRYFAARGRGSGFDDDAIDAARKAILDLVHGRKVSLLLVKLFADRLLAADAGSESGQVPRSIPALMTGYVVMLNDKISGRRSPSEVIQAAEIVAFECLRDRHQPDAALRTRVLDTLGSNGEEMLRYLEERLQLVSTLPPRYDRVRYRIDPLAEHLAAQYVVEANGPEEERWRSFFAEADEKEGAPSATKVFLNSVRSCCLEPEAGRLPDFVLPSLDRRVGLDEGEVQRAATRRRIAELIRELGRTREDAVRYAAWALAEMGADAEPAMGALASALVDGGHDLEVKEALLHALGNIGGFAKASVPSILDAFSEEPRLRQSTVQALQAIGLDTRPYTDALERWSASPDRFLTLLSIWTTVGRYSAEKEVLEAVISSLQVAIRDNPRDQRLQDRLKDLGQISREGKRYCGGSSQMLPVVTPLAIEVSEDIEIFLVAKHREEGLAPRIEVLCEELKQLFQEVLGVRLPGFRFRSAQSLLPRTFVFMINEVPFLRSTVPETLPSLASELSFLEMRLPGRTGAREGRSGYPSNRAWAAELGVDSSRVAGPVEFLILRCHSALLFEVSEFMGHQEVANNLEQYLPSLAEDFRNDWDMLTGLTLTIRALLREIVSIRSFDAIVFRFLELWRARTDEAVIVEEVRNIPQVRRLILGNDPAFSFRRLSSRLELLFGYSVQGQGASRFLQLDEANSQLIQKAFEGLEEIQTKVAVVVSDWRLRPIVAEYLRFKWPLTPVLAEREIVPEAKDRFLGDLDAENGDC